MEEQEITIVSATFRHSTQMDQVFDALSKAQGEMDGARKDATNPHFKSKYADLESVMDACRPAFAKYGIAVMQPTSANGARVTVTTLLGHKSGQWIASDLEMTSAQNTPQGIGSTITYGRRYGLSSMAGIAPEDDDGTAGSQGGSSQQQERAAPPAPRAAVSQPKPVAPAPKPATAGSFDVAKMRSTIAAFESQLGRTAFLRILGAEGFESVDQIGNRDAGTRVHGLMKAEADKPVKVGA